MALLAFASASARATDADPAARAYERALSLYDSGDVSGALASMRESYRLSGRWELLYNIARLEDELGDCAASLADYQQYLERVPQGKYRALATEASTKLSKRCPPIEGAPGVVAPAASSGALASPVANPADAATVPVSDAVPSSPGVVSASVAAAPAPTPPTSAPSERLEHRATVATRADAGAGVERWIGWSAIAAGGLAGVGAVYFTASAFDARSRFRSSLQREVQGGSYADFGLQDEQHRDQRWAQVLAVTGGALVGGGVLVLVLGGRAPASASVTAGVWLEPRCLSAQISSRF